MLSIGVPYLTTGHLYPILDRGLCSMIRVQNLNFAYPGNAPVLQEIDLEIPAGTWAAIIGANGSGKTTLARCLNGLHLPRKGQVLVDDLCTRDPEALFEIRKRIGMVFQNPDDQLVSTTVEAEIAFGLENLSVPTEQIQRRIDEILKEFHLESYRRHPPHRLSGGEKQRVAIAAAVALHPRYLVLDEPTALLDPRARSEIGALLRQLRDQFGITTIHITQSPSEAATADRVIVMHQGRLLYDGTPDEVYRHAAELQEMGLDIPFTSALAANFRARTKYPLGVRLDMDSLASALVPVLASPPTAMKNPATPQNGSIKLAAESLTHIYDRGLPTERTAIRAIDAEFPSGCIVALIGRSGAGKTTLAQHFNALLKPHGGRVLLDGGDIWDGDCDSTRIRQQVGLVFQFPELQLFEETVALDVAFGPRNLGFPEKMIEESVNRSLQVVDLPREHFGQRSPMTLSGGEKRRVALAGILAMAPDVLVLDEPTAGLDGRTVGKLCEVFLQLKEQGKTLVLITHNIDLVAELSTHILVLEHGEVQASGATRDLLSDPDFPSFSGLEAPAAVQLTRALAARNLPVPSNLITLREVADFIAANFVPPP